MKVKSESEVAQFCLTLSNPMDCSLPEVPLSMGFSRHKIDQSRVLLERERDTHTQRGRGKEKHAIL